MSLNDPVIDPVIPPEAELNLQITGLSDRGSLIGLRYAPLLILGGVQEFMNRVYNVIVYKRTFTLQATKVTPIRSVRK